MKNSRTKTLEKQAQKYDVNGALNILRKVVNDSEIIFQIINSGWLFQPVKFNNLYLLRSVKVYK